MGPRAVPTPSSDRFLLLQQATDQIDAVYQPKLGQARKGREKIQVQGIFGRFELNRDYYYHQGKKQGHYPADAALGLETGYTPALARLICLEGADETSYQKAETHLLETAGIEISARQIQRVAQRVGAHAQQWQQREVEPGACSPQRVPTMYISADGTGVPVRKEELVGRKGKGPDGLAKTRQAYLGCVFTQHGVDEKGHPVRDWESQTEAVEKELAYFVGNIPRMQYGTFRTQGFLIGSGVIEAGCKTVIGVRCKQSGMFWGKPGAENILALRGIHSSRRLDEFWKYRMNYHAATNDALPLVA